MKTRELKPNERYDTEPKKYEKSKIYKITKNVDILVYEEQPKNNTKDYVMLHYQFNEGEVGYFSEEYLPDGMSKDGVKKPDITAIVENPATKKAKWFIYDIKDTVRNAATAYKLAGQWHSGIANIYSTYIRDLQDDYIVSSSLGAITRCLDKDELVKEKEHYRGKIASVKTSIAARKSLVKIQEYKEKVRAIQWIIDEVFEDEEESTGEIKKYSIRFIPLKTDDRVIYKADMIISQ